MASFEINYSTNYIQSNGFDRFILYTLKTYYEECQDGRILTIPEEINERIRKNIKKIDLKIDKEREKLNSQSHESNTQWHFSQLRTDMIPLQLSYLYDKKKRYLSFNMHNLRHGIELEIINLIEYKWKEQTPFTEIEIDVIDLFNNSGQLKRTKSQQEKIDKIINDNNNLNGTSHSYDEVLSVHLENGQTGVTYKDIFDRYLGPAHWIKIMDPFIRNDDQINNVLRILSLVNKPNECRVHLVTFYDKFDGPYTKGFVTDKIESLKKILESKGFFLTFEFDEDFQDRWIITDHWRIHFGRGLDIFYYKDSQLMCRKTDINFFPIKL